MLDEFILKNRDVIIAGSRARGASRASSRSTDAGVANGASAFLDQLSGALRSAKSLNLVDHESIETSAARHGITLFEAGFSIGQVVHDYADVCQVLAELAIAQKLPISGEEFRRFGLCLEDAIAGAVTEWAQRREVATHSEETERLGFFAHELRNLLGRGMLAYDGLKRGQIGIGGSTGQLLGRSLTGLRDLIDRALANVRLEARIERFERICVSEFLAEIEIVAAMQAEELGLQFKASSVERAVAIEGDRQILAAAVSNLLQNAFKFTREGGIVSLTTQVTPLRVLFKIEDQCGGLPPGKLEELFAPYSQRGKDRTGIGLGLPISLRAAKANGGEISVRDIPGKGCVFTLNLPKRPSSGSSSRV